MQVRYAIGKEQYSRMSAEELRRNFLLENLFAPGRVELVCLETERTVLGGVVPAAVPLPLETDPVLAADYFCERRELGVFNLGGPGQVTVDGQPFSLASRDAIYIGRGSREVVFDSAGKEKPARFFLISYPAHARRPVRLIPGGSANRVDLGSAGNANLRTISQYIHEEGAPSCQLVAGLTQLKPGSVWNTMPPHTHLRRSEVYFYFDLPENGAVFHFMGTPEETRHVVVRNEQAVFSPSWSIHSGCGTGAYSFLWAMGGENQKFTDMDAVPVDALK